jgi:hypothetical protein
MPAAAPSRNRADALFATAGRNYRIVLALSWRLYSR